jgi:hypothetical protein
MPKKEMEIQAHAARSPMRASLEVALLNALREALHAQEIQVLERDSEARSDRVGAVNPSHAEDDADKGLHGDR